MITYAELKEKPKEFLAATGLHVNEFEQLIPKFKEKLAATRSPDQTKKGKHRRRRAGAGQKEKLQTTEDKLVFTWVYQKTYSLPTMLGLHFGLSQPRANYWVHFLMPILQEVLAEMGMTPERDPQAVAHNPLVNASGPDLLMDGTERRRQPPKRPRSRQSTTAGRKKRIPTKTSCWQTCIPKKWSISARQNVAKNMTRKSPMKMTSLTHVVLPWARTPAFKATNLKVS